MADVRFASWAQSPVGQAIEEADHAGALGPADFKPGLTLTRPDGTTMPAKGPELTMLGPGGVASLDPRAVVRTDPPPGAGEVEDNYLASVELLPIELPWLFTPARPGPPPPPAPLDTHGRLRPWIVLVVVETERSDLVPGTGLPTLTVSADQLPDLDDSWGWAHVQVHSADVTLPPGIKDLVGQDVARLVCPRRLAPNTRYRAAIVPAFKGGAQAGRGLPVDPATEHAHAWEADQADDAQLPVLFSWEFGTGAEGDFEQLVRRLEPAPPDRVQGLGTRLIDVAEPWPTGEPLDTAPSPATVPVSGALRSLLDPPSGTAPATALQDFAQRLTTQLDAPAERLARAPESDDSTGAVAPPIYGGRHVNQARLPATRAWLDQLNLNPATRIAAGIGAAYVRANQDTLMARAWEQVGAIREANRRRALAELAATVADSVHRRHVQTLEPGEAVTLVAPAAWRARTGDDGLTLGAEVVVSTLPDAAATPAFARFVRRHSVARASGTRASSVVERGMAGSVSVPEPQPLLERLDVSTAAGMPDAIGVAANAAVQAGESVAAASSLVVMQAVERAARVNGLATEADALSTRLNALDVDEAQVSTGQIRMLSLDIAPRLQTVVEGLAAARAEMAADIQPAETPAVTAFGVQVDVAGLLSRVEDALAPADRIAQRLATTVSVPGTLGSSLSLEPIMAHPVFPAPMALALKDFALDWFLPGIANFPAESATLLQQDGPFIESFLVGLAEEMNRELRWREFPTDLRGTPFRRFWPRPDGVDDIPEIHTFDHALGQHLTMSEHAVAVLLVRGSVVRRFPDMVVAAVSAKPGVIPPDPDVDGGGWIRPLFLLPVDPDTAAYAFALDPTMLKTPAAPGAEGFFFAFQEHSYRVRFGFDLPETDPPDPNREYRTWNDLDWPRVPQRRGFARADLPLPPPDDPGDAQWNRDAADVARITLQRPFRVLIHAHALVGD
jgi:hypothetical protein